MGLGYTNPNQVYYDNDEGQYYTMPNSPAPSFNNYFANSAFKPFNEVAMGQRDYLGAIAPSANKSKISMVTSGMDRAQAAYDALMSGMGTNPAYNQYAMFPGMQMQSQPMTSLPMYGAGRFLSPAQAQDTGGVLGINSTQS
jgi:hypothetical protein